MPDADQTGQAQTPPSAHGANPNGAGTTGSDVTDTNLVNSINAAVSSQLKRALAPDKLQALITPLIGATLEQALPGVLETALKPIHERLVKPVEEPKKGDHKATKPLEPDPEVASLRAQVNKMEEQLKAERARATSEARKRAEAQAHAAARAALAGHVRPEAADVVLDLLRHRQLLQVDEEGNARLKVRAAPAAGLPEEEQVLPFAEALPLWLKSPEAALFTPPPKPGARPGAPRPPHAHGPPQSGGQDIESRFEARTGQRLDDVL